MADEINAQNIVVGLDSSGVEAGVVRVKQSISTLDGATTEVGKGFDRMGDEAKKGFDKTDTAAKATNRTINAFTSQIKNSIIDINAAGDAAERYRLKAIDKGIPENVYGPYVSQLREATAAQAALAAQSVASGRSIASDITPRLNEMGMTAKGTAAALRNVPAQLTDIVVGLQGGQAPLTVLLQQGGQLKDMFGGVGNAAKVLGGYLISLVNPYTVVLAAAAGLAYAYSKGAAESQAYNKALIETGGIAGVTAARLADMSTAVANASGVTVSAAAEALVALASSGNIISSQFERIAAVAVSSQKATGTSVADTIKQFEALGKDPVSAAKKLNETVNFLTLSVYEQIKALEAQGRTLEAGVVAQNAFADVMEKRTPLLVENLGYIESAWNIVTQAIKGAGSALAGIGRDTTLSDTARELREKIKLQESIGAQGGLNSGGKLRLDALKAELVLVEANIAETERLGGAAAARESDRLRGQSAAIEATDRIAKITERAATKQEQLTKALREYRQDLEKIRAADANSPMLNPALVSRNEQNIRDQYAGPKVKPGDPFAADREAAKSWAKYYEDFSKLAANAEAKVEGLSKAQAKLVEYLESPAYANMAEPARQLALEQAYAAIASEQVSAALKASTKAHEDYLTSLRSSANAVSGKLKSMRDEVQAYQVSIDQNISLAQAIDVVAIARLQEKLAEQMSYGDVDAVAILQAEIDARKELLGLINSQDARKESIKAAKDAASEWKKTANEINRTLTDALMRAFEGGASFAQAMRDTIVNMFKTMVLRPVVNAVMGTITGALGFGGSAAAGQGGSGSGDNLSVAQTLKGAYDTIAGGFVSISASTSAYLGELGVQMLASSNAAISNMGSTVINASGTIGSAVGLAAGAAAGLAIGSAISGEYGSSGTVVAGTLIGAVVGGPIGAAIGGAIGGLVNRTFGMGAKTVQSSGMRGTFNESGFSGENYANMQQKGGFFRSNRNWTEVTALAAGVADAMSESFMGTKVAVAQVALSLGLGIDGIVDYSKTIDLAAGTTQEAITKMFVGMADDMANAVAPGLDAMALKGETASVTLSRLGTALTTANAWLSLLNQRLFQISLSGGNAASKLAEAFGGLENLTTASKSFYETYYTEGERAARSQQDMTTALKLVNLALPVSMEALRDLAGTLDLNTAAGRQAYAVLLTIAPEFANTAAALEKLAAQTAVNLIKTFTGNGALVPALSVVELGIGGFTDSTRVMSGELSYINSIMGDATSTVIGFSSGAYVLSSNLTRTQLSASLLTEQLIDLRASADGARLDFVGLDKALVGVDTQTFVATITLAFENLATRISTVLSDINSERIALREAAIQILNPTVLTKGAINAGIGAINTTLPGSEGVTAAAASLTVAQARVIAATTASAIANAQMSTAGDAVSSQRTVISGTTTAMEANRAAVRPLQDFVNVIRSDWNGWSYGQRMRANEYMRVIAGLDVTYNQLSAALVTQKSTLDSLSSQYDASATNVEVYAAALAAQQVLQAAATEAAKAAVIAYASATQDFVIDAGKSVGKLTTLRQETVKYFEAQSKLADLMQTSAAGIRSTIAAYTFNQMTSEQQFQDLSGQFSTAFAMTQVTTGETLAGYGDKLNALINPLIESLSATGRDNLIATFLAQAEIAAANVENGVTALGDYQQDSLDMLGSIDATLAVLDASSQSAEKIISEAVKAGSDLTAAGLRAVVAALVGGEIPAFASGGTHQGGVRLVGENGPELEITGPSRIYNAGQTQGMFGPRESGTASLLQAVLQSNANMSAELRAIATATVKTARLIDRAMPEGDAISTRAATA